MNEIIIIIMLFSTLIASCAIWQIASFILSNICFILYRILCKGKMGYKQYIKAMMNKFGLE